MWYSLPALCCFVGIGSSGAAQQGVSETGVTLTTCRLKKCGEMPCFWSETATQIDGTTQHLSNRAPDTLILSDWSCIWCWPSAPLCRDDENFAAKKRQRKKIASNSRVATLFPGPVAENSKPGGQGPYKYAVLYVGCCSLWFFRCSMVSKTKSTCCRSSKACIHLRGNGFLRWHHDKDKRKKS